MRLYPKSLLRAAAVAATILSLNAGALPAKQHVFAGSFRDTGLIDPILSLSLAPPPAPPVNLLGIRLDIASTGWVSCMSYPVVSLTNDQTNKLMPSDGAMYLDPSQATWLLTDAQLPPYTGVGTYTLRDISGDSIIFTFNLVMDPPGKHTIMFHGVFTVTGGTGRFAGATGQANCTGWAEYDDPNVPTSFYGGWEFTGTINLVEVPHCPGKH